MCGFSTTTKYIVDSFSPSLSITDEHPKKGTNFPKEVKPSATEFTQTMESIWEETAALYESPPNK